MTSNSNGTMFAYDAAVTSKHSQQQQQPPTIHHGQMHSEHMHSSPSTPPRTITSPLTLSTAALNRQIHNLQLPPVELPSPLYNLNISHSMEHHSAGQPTDDSTDSRAIDDPSSLASKRNGSRLASPIPQSPHPIHQSSVIHESHSSSGNNSPNVVAPYRSSSN